MKNFTLLAIFVLFSAVASAQLPGDPNMGTSNNNAVDENGIPIDLKQAPKFTGKVIGTIGTSFSADDIKHLPTRNVNKIAATTLGVQAQPGGGPPIIGGAEGGTAYYVDGIRIRSGGLGVAGLSY